MNQTFYLVCLVGIYDGGEGDHSTFLFDSYEKAKEQFKKTIEEIREYYGKESYLRYEEFYKEGLDYYSLATQYREELVDIWIEKLTPDGKMSSTIF